MFYISVTKNIYEIGNIHCQIEMDPNDDQEQFLTVFQKSGVV